MLSRLFAQLITAAAVPVLIFGLSGTATATPFGTNLIVNGDAEANVGGDGSTTIVPTGWTTLPGLTVVRWGVPGGYPAFSDPGPASRGLNFFAGGEATGVTNGKQSIDVSAGAAAIDLGSVAFVLDGFLGGYQSQGDYAVLTAIFYDALNTQLGISSIGPVTNGDRGDLTGLLQRTTTGFVPVATRSIGIVLELTRLAGTYDDGYADNLSLVLRDAPGTAAVPEPATLFLLGIGLAGIGVARRKNARKA